LSGRPGKKASTVGNEKLRETRLAVLDIVLRWNTGNWHFVISFGSLGRALDIAGRWLDRLCGRVCKECPFNSSNYFEHSEEKAREV
jgi:hypothetical protein